jgi:hypothetical protein
LIVVRRDREEEDIGFLLKVLVKERKCVIDKKRDGGWILDGVYFVGLSVVDAS